MRLLVLENEPSSRRGGQELSLFDVCRGLATRGHEVHLAFNTDGDLVDRYRAFCSGVTRVGAFDLDRARTLRSATGWLSSLGALRGAPADLVYVNQYQDTPFAHLLARVRGLPLACHLRLYPPDRACFQWRLGLRGVTRFIANSVAVRDAYVRAGFPPGSLAIVMNGIDVERFRIDDDRAPTRASLGIEGIAFTVLFVGRLDRNKNLEQLLRAFSRLRSTHPDALLLVAGRPVSHASAEEGEAYVEELRTLARSLGVDSSVRWLGHRTDTPRLFRAADVSVLASTKPEPFGRTIVESMACGVPSLGARDGGIPEILTGEFEQHLFKSDDDLVDRLRALAGWRTQDPDLARRCRKHVVARFSTDAMVERVEGVLRATQALGPRRLGPRLSGRANR